MADLDVADVDLSVTRRTRVCLRLIVVVEVLCCWSPLLRYLLALQGKELHPSFFVGFRVRVIEGKSVLLTVLIGVVLIGVDT